MNQNTLANIIETLQGMRETKIYTPMQEGEIEVLAEDKSKN
jgi:hypothetical protein